jgi:hypothetical protein
VSRMAPGGLRQTERAVYRAFMIESLSALQHSVHRQIASMANFNP